ncbi:hypothetical protein [Pedobacter nototheniae]|uniref:hypothetical protein n=1 Tax=Pedobacter nototheniae TaxID=2488994 RepID=UPI00292EB422|nr:hypothetical protein [Pedobacter nototheniae]
MKVSLIIGVLFFISSSIALGQTKVFKIEGVIKDETPYKYAYLYCHKSKELKRAPISNHLFVIEGKTDSIDTNAELGQIFLGLDSNQKFIDNREVYLSGINREYRPIVLENLSINITPDIKESIVHGSQLNVDLDEMYVSINTNKIEDYFPTHTDTPISLVFLRAMLPMKKMPNFSLSIDFINCFNVLSDRLKNSVAGKKLLEAINE